MEASAEDITKALVYNHLKEMTPKLAEEFALKHSFSEITLRMKDVVKAGHQSSSAILDLLARSVAKLKEREQAEANKALMDKQEKGKPGDGTKNYESPVVSLEFSTVFNHLEEVAPTLANEFEKLHIFPRNVLRLEYLVKLYNSSKPEKKANAENPTTSKYKRSLLHIGSTKRFTPEEDEMIRGYITETAGHRDFRALAMQFGRKTSVVVRRAEGLERNGGRSCRKRFTLVEDQVILETLILPRLRGEKLSQITLQKNQCAELNKEFDKDPNGGVFRRWAGCLQPWLLQHYTGTLNLRIERMLASHIWQTFAHFSFIDWPAVVARREFAGHTEASLRKIYLHILYKNTKLKFGLASSDVTLLHIVEYAEQTYGAGPGSLHPGRVQTSENKLERQRKVIAFFERKVAERGIKGFM